ncbi:GL10578 [Drosophila persimilis]|uniref:GL10578 n=1 Tax=Drosophila persimilis TaxID=7234 RepID=B4GB63_DROPE|nr:GL10578 [Drosophila persimilis]
MWIQSIFLQALTILLVGWLGHVICQSDDHHLLTFGQSGEGPPGKIEFPVWDDAQGEWPGLSDHY